MDTAVALEFAPTNLTMAEIKAAIPPQLFVRNTRRAFVYLARDLVLVALFGWTVTELDRFLRADSTSPGIGIQGARCLLWLAYWWFQGLAFTGVWVIGHECCHDAFSSNRTICGVTGFILHTILWTPFFSWRISHHRHHLHHGSMEKDEVYVPKTRKDLRIPKDVDSAKDHTAYEDYFGDTPLWTLLMLIRQQVLAFPAYLLFNVSGQKSYPKYTNHFSPNSVIFTPAQFNAVIVSNLGILGMVWLTAKSVSIFGAANVIKYYGIPWLAVTHWFIMITYLHHTAPEIPHYRAGEFNYQRGAAATMDRDFLGWQGRFFLHDVAHYHVIHHFFPKLPWYNGKDATKYLKEVLGSQYLYSNEPVFQALWGSYNNCQFVEDEGDILFYRDKKGNFARRVTN